MCPTRQSALVRVFAGGNGRKNDDSRRLLDRAGGGELHRSCRGFVPTR